MMQSEKITEGPIGVGTRFRATARSGRRVVEMLIEVTECDRARRFGSRTVMPSVDVTGGLTFEPIDGATRMSWSWEVSPRGRCGCCPLVGRLGCRQRTVWTGLKTQMEGSGPARDTTEQ